MSARGPLAVVLVAISTTALPAPAAAAPGLRGPAGTSRDKVLVIGMDGTRWDVLRRLVAAGRAPNLAGLGRRGLAVPTLLRYQPPAAATVSQVGWTTIASGVWPARHGVTDPTNASPGQRTKNGYADFLTRIERARPRLSTMLASDWANLGLPVLGGPIFPRADARLALAASGAAGYDADDRRLADAAAGHLRRRGPDASFVYFGAPDEAGHAYGSESRRYADAIARTDRRIGQLRRAIDARRTRRCERWTIIVTTDHGQTGTVHGGGSRLERTSFVIAEGPGLRRREARRPVRVVDVAPTVLHQLGVGIARPRPLDGRSLVRARPSRRAPRGCRTRGGGLRPRPARPSRG